MRRVLKWPGFNLVALGITVFPFAIWYPGPWGVLSLVMIMVGCFMLVIARPAESGLAGSDEAESPIAYEDDRDKPAH